MLWIRLPLWGTRAGCFWTFRQALWITAPVCKMFACHLVSMRLWHESDVTSLWKKAFLGQDPSFLLFVVSPAIFGYRINYRANWTWSIDCLAQWLWSLHTSFSMGLAQWSEWHSWMLSHSVPLSQQLSATVYYSIWHVDKVVWCYQGQGSHCM